MLRNSRPTPGPVSSPTTACLMHGAASPKQLWLITGPNMAGKSTFLRQNALIALLAQMGAFVPAASAHIGVIDRLFSRVGAADDLARGRSTFMVEMVETAAILNQATGKSFVILDEIGRGTATFDGLSIAWATLRTSPRPASNRCRALFATHYHRAHRTGGAAGGPCAPHHAGQRVARRGGVPARSRPRRRRPLLRHPCRPSRRPAAGGHHPRRKRCWRCSEKESPPSQAGTAARNSPMICPCSPQSLAPRGTPAAARESGRRPTRRRPGRGRPRTPSRPREALEILYRLKGLVREPKA